MSVPSIIKSVNDAIAGLPGPGEIKEEERLELLAACEKLKSSLESPFEFATRIIFGPYLLTALKLGVDMGLFNIMAAAQGAELDASQLASKSGAEPLLIIRIMRLLVGINLAKEVAPGRYIALPFAAAFVDESPLTAAVIHFTALAEVMAKLPEYFEKSGYKNPGDAYDGPFQYAMNTKLHWFEDLKTKPKEQAAFNTMMRISRVGRGEEWFDFYPIVEKFQKEFTADKDTPLLVDIGGGLGHDLTAFQVKFPDLPGRLILQDLPAAIDGVKEIGPGIEKMKYDFFTPQPVKGARAYYLRTVLHDWPDKQAIKILETIKAAMSKDSLLLVNENTLQEVNVPLYPAELDWTMMAHFASLERTEKQWIQLLDSAGFKVVRVWKPNVVLVGSGTLFEAVPKL